MAKYIFDKMDVNGDGKITKAEFIKYMENIFLLFSDGIFLNILRINIQLK